MEMDDYEIIFYRNPPGGWVAEIPAIPSCYALMDTREEALAELSNVFAMCLEYFTQRGDSLPPPR